MATTLAAPLVVITDDNAAVDVERASDGRFGPDPQGGYGQWSGFRKRRAGADLPAGRSFAGASLGPPAPAPSQAPAVGLDYRAHAAESGFEAPGTPPPVLTRYASSVTGPVTEARLPEGGHTDREVELVAVTGERAYRIDEDDAWPYVAGPAVGQDISERITRLTGPAPQFVSASPSRGSPRCGRTR
ncbi:fumarylacetoacetate hydrolase family protein [Streptomyces sp. NPDC002143]